MIGSLLVTFNETPDNRGGSSFNVLVNNINRDTHFTDVNDYYSTRLSVGDVVRFTANFTNDLYSEISVIRKDFTTDDEQGDKGIKQTNIDYDVIIQSFSSYVIQFTATTITSAYDFYYVVNVNTTTPTCFSIGSGFNNKTWQSKIQSDGKIVVGGDFTSYNGVSRTRLTRINSNGTIDFTFTVGTGPNNRVRVVTLQSDEKVLIGGDFTTVSGLSRNSLARINSNGTLDTGFTIGTGFNNVLYEITVQSDGKILCGGEFTSYSGTSINRIIRLNTDGTIDTSFNVGTGANFEVNNIKQQSDGKILVGGSLTTYNGTGVGRFVRLNSDGSIDSSFSGLTTGFDDTIYNITIYSDGKILVSGAFEIYNGVTRRRIVRLNSDGSFDSSFTPLSDANGFIYGQAIQSDGKIIIVGNFTTVNGQSRSGIARLNSDGTLDSTYNVGSGFVITDIIEDVQLTSDGKAIITGGFTSYNGTSANRIIRLNTDGSEDTCNFPVTPTPTPTVSVTPSNTPTPSITPSSNVSPTPTPSITPTLTPTPTPPVDNTGSTFIVGQSYIPEPNDAFPYCSTDGGVTFYQNTPTTPNRLSSIGRDGIVKYIGTSRYYNNDTFRFVNGYIRYRTYAVCNNAFGYSQITELGLRDWNFLRVSGNGLYAVFGANDGTYKYTNDLANTFYDYTSFGGYSVDTQSLVLSYDASVQTFCVNPLSSGTTVPLVINSTNTSSSWTPSTTTVSGSYARRVMMNYNTNRKTAASNDGVIYVSSDSGNTFSTQTITISGETIYSVESMDMDDSGQYQFINFITFNGRRLYKSSDYGSTWIRINSMDNSKFVNVSSTGKNVHLIYNDQIYKSSNYGSSFSYLNSIPNNNLLTLSVSKL